MRLTRRFDDDPGARPSERRPDVVSKDASVESRDGSTASISLRVTQISRSGGSRTAKSVPAECRAIGCKGLIGERVHDDRHALSIAADCSHWPGNCAPRRADIEMTREIAAAKPLKIAVHDHLVIGRSGHASFKSLGLP
jgi:hypothetical protein